MWINIGEGFAELSLAVTIANSTPKYGATMGFFPFDHVTLQYLKLTGFWKDCVSSSFLFFSLCFILDFFVLFMVLYLVAGIVV